MALYGCPTVLRYLRLCSSPELQCLYAMANKVRFSPIVSMLAHWQKMIVGKNPIDVTSPVMRIVVHVGALENSQLTYLPSTEGFPFQISLEHFVQGHLMREGPRNFFMCYPGYDQKIELPCLRLSLLSQATNSADGEERAGMP